jgi:hypothetical protein
MKEISNPACISARFGAFQPDGLCCLPGSSLQPKALPSAVLLPVYSRDSRPLHGLFPALACHAPAHDSSHFSPAWREPGCDLHAPCTPTAPAPTLLHVNDRLHFLSLQSGSRTYLIIDRCLPVSPFPRIQNQLPSSRHHSMSHTC